MKRWAAGVVQLALVGAIVSGLGMAGAGVAGYFKGKRVAAAERNTHWQAQIDRMQAQHRAAVEAETARTRAVEEQWRIARQGADHERERERAANAARVAAVAADRDRLRDELARAAAGGVAAADDSIGACRDRAEAFGRVLGDVLRGFGRCAAEAEDLAAELRRVRSAWPTGEVTP